MNSENSLNQISLNWNKLPNEHKLRFNNNNNTPPSNLNSPDFLLLSSLQQHSPPSSIASSSLISITPESQGSPSLPLQPLQPSIYPDSTGSSFKLQHHNNSQQTTNSDNLTTLYPEGLAFLNSNKERDFGLTAFGHSPPHTTSIHLVPNNIDSVAAVTQSTTAENQTQLALAEIFSGNPRPYRSSSFSSSSAHTSLPSPSHSTLPLPLPHLSPHPLSPSLTSTSSSSNTTTPRSYFSPPIPNLRVRSQSSAPALDRNMSYPSSTSTSTTSHSFLSPTSPPFPIPVPAPMNVSLSTEYRTPTTSALSNYFSSSLPTSISQTHSHSHLLSTSPASTTSRSNFDDYHNNSITANNNGNTSTSNLSRPQTLQHFSSFTGNLNGSTSTSSFGNGAYEQQQQQQQHQQGSNPGWRTRSQSASSPSASNFGQWDESTLTTVGGIGGIGIGIEREGRSQIRGVDLEDYRTNWSATTTIDSTNRDLSTSSRRNSSASIGIGLSNLSPFSRDGRSLLSDFNVNPALPSPSLSHSSTTIPLLSSSAGSTLSTDYPPRREYSLGPVGSGRKRSDSIWGRERPLTEELEGDLESDDIFAPPTRSGTTSRRHSVATFNAPSLNSISGKIGLSHDLSPPLPSSGLEGRISRSTSISGTGGFTMITPGLATTSNFNTSNGFSNTTHISNKGYQYSTRGSGLGSSAIDDDDLIAADLNSLQLNLEAHTTTTNNNNNTSYTTSQSLPVPLTTQYARRVEESLSRSPPTSTSTSTSQFSPPSAASRFFQPQPQPLPQTNQVQNGNNATGNSILSTSGGSRFEFGAGGGIVGGAGNSSGSPSFNQNLELSNPNSSNQQVQHQQQVQQVQQQALISNHANTNANVNLRQYNPYGSQQQQQQQTSSVPLQPPTTNSYYPISAPPPPPSLLPMLSAQSPAFLSYPLLSPQQHLQQQLHQQQLHHQVQVQQQQQQQQHQAYYSPQSSTLSSSNLPLSPLPLSSPVPELTNLGRGIPLHSIPSNTPLYIVEFKAGRKDLFFIDPSSSLSLSPSSSSSLSPSMIDPNNNSNGNNLHNQLKKGDLVIVEADRGKDIGKFFKICTREEVQIFQQRLVENALGVLANPQNNINGGLNVGGGVGGGGGGGGGNAPNSAAIARMTKEFQPKKIFGKAMPLDTQMLLSKAQDELKALTLIRGRVAQKNLAMEICDAEWQWDRRKLTFYYIADSRVDFRELVRELFRLYKTRIWMCCLDQSNQWSF